MCRALPFGQKNTPPALVWNNYINWKCPGQITKNILSLIGPSPEDPQPITTLDATFMTVCSRVLKG